MFGWRNLSVDGRKCPSFQRRMLDAPREEAGTPRELRLEFQTTEERDRLASGIKRLCPNLA